MLPSFLSELPAPSTFRAGCFPSRLPLPSEVFFATPTFFPLPHQHKISALNSDFHAAKARAIFAHPRGQRKAASLLYCPRVVRTLLFSLLNPNRTTRSRLFPFSRLLDDDDRSRSLCRPQFYLLALCFSRISPSLYLALNAAPLFYPF